MNRSITIRPQDIPMPEYGTRGGRFGMDMKTSQRTAELNAENAGRAGSSPEAQVVHTKKAFELPIHAEVAAHDAAHCPYMSWCEACVVASVKEDAPSRSPRMDETGLPIVA